MNAKRLKPVAWVVAAILFILGSGLVALQHTFDPSETIPAYLLLTVIVAWRAGLIAAVTVAVCATLGLDFFFTQPKLSLTIASRQDVVALVLFAAVSVVISHLSRRIRAEADALEHSEAEQRALYELSRSALLLDWKASVDEQLCFLVQERMRLAGVALWDAREGTLTSSGNTAHAEDRLKVACRTERSYDAVNALEKIRILRFGVRPVGAMLFCGLIDQLTADSIATLVATHLERVRALKAEVSAESQAVSERLRTAVLDGLAHAVKTPLTTIVLSSSGLREVGSLTPLQAELAQIIESQASYLAQVTDQLLRTAKLEGAGVLLKIRVTRFSALVSAVLDELRIVYDVSRVQFMGDQGADITVDPDIFRMVLVQVIENALKYSMDATPVTVSFSCDEDRISLSVYNEGSFIPPDECDLVFERYYRAQETQHKASGTGVGLSVAKQAVEAHGGRIWLESHRKTGTAFHITVPR